MTAAAVMRKGDKLNRKQRVLLPVKRGSNCKTVHREVAWPAWRGESVFSCRNKNGAEAGDVAGVGRYLRFEEDDVKWRFRIRNCYIRNR